MPETFNNVEWLQCYPKGVHYHLDTCLSNASPSIMKKNSFIINRLIHLLDSNHEKISFFLSQDKKWEKWFQMELGYELKKRSTVQFEVPYEKNKQCKKQKNKNGGRIDLVLDGNIAIELKFGQKITQAASVFKDIEKARSIKKANWPYERFYFILLYRRPLKKTGKNSILFNQLLKEFPQEVKLLDGSKTQNYEQNEFKCLILEWKYNPNLTTRDPAIQMSKWCSKLLKYKENFEKSRSND